MKLWANVLATLVIGIVAGLVCAADAGRMQKKAEKAVAPRALQGVVAAVDIEKKTVTVAVKEKGALKEIVVQTDANTKVTIDGQQATLGDLKKDYRVKVTPGTGVAQLISAKAKTQTRPGTEKPKPRKADKPAQ